MSFGNVGLNSPVTQSVILTSSGTAPVTVSTAVILGAGFTVSGSTLPVTLNAGQTATLNVQFDPDRGRGCNRHAHDRQHFIDESTPSDPI